MLFRDARGKELSIEEPPRRVVSLVPSLTETLFDIGAGNAVIGITDWCIFPPDLTLPRLGGTKNPRVDEIRALRPDLVYMNREENLARHAEEIEAFAPLFVSEPKSVQDVASLIVTLGAIHDRTAQAFASVSRLAQASVSGPAFTFACAIWKKPWMWCGGDTYVSNLIAAVGGTNVLGPARRYPTIELIEVASLKPEVIFLPDEPYSFSDADAEELRELTGGRVIGPFPGHLLTWHGTRTILGLQFLRRELTPGK